MFIEKEFIIHIEFRKAKEMERNGKENFVHDVHVWWVVSPRIQRYFKLGDEFLMTLFISSLKVLTYMLVFLTVFKDS